MVPLRNVAAAIVPARVTVPRPAPAGTRRAWVARLSCAQPLAAPANCGAGERGPLMWRRRHAMHADRERRGPIVREVVRCVPPIPRFLLA